MPFLDSIVGSLASLLIGTLLGAEVSRFLYKPKVIIRYKEIEPLYTDDGIFWSLSVENLGRTVATNCTGRLTLYNVVSSDVLDPSDAIATEDLPSYRHENIDLEFPREQIVKPRYFRQLRTTSLCWAKLGNPDLLDINPGISQALDLCKFQRCSTGSYFIFPSEFGWRRLRLRLRSAHFRGRVHICPSNEFPTLVDFEFSVDDSDHVTLTVSPVPARWKIWRRWKS